MNTSNDTRALNAAIDLSQIEPQLDNALALLSEARGILGLLVERPGDSTTSDAAAAARRLLCIAMTSVEIQASIFRGHEASVHRERLAAHPIQ